MQSFFAIKNASSRPCISVSIDGERIFDCILKGQVSPYILLDCGSIAVCAYDNYEKKFLDKWISVSPYKRHTLSVYDNFMFFT